MNGNVRAILEALVKDNGKVVYDFENRECQFCYGAGKRHKLVEHEDTCIVSQAKRELDLDKE